MSVDMTEEICSHMMESMEEVVPVSDAIVMNKTTEAAEDGGTVPTWSLQESSGYYISSQFL